jgi:hypothetical protein
MNDQPGVHISSRMNDQPGFEGLAIFVATYVINATVCFIYLSLYFFINNYYQSVTIMRGVPPRLSLLV